MHAAHSNFNDSLQLTLREPGDTGRGPYAQRNRAETTVERLQSNLLAEGHELSREQIIDFYRELESVGCGSFKAGRRGWSSRFLWTVEMVSVGRAAAGEAEDTEQITDQTELDKGDEVATHSHTFLLRPALEIHFELPTDLTTIEAQRLGTFLGTLPFNGA